MNGERFVPSAGITFRVRIDGPADAPAVLFSNSVGTRLELWDAQVAALAGRYRAIRYDSRGHGRTDSPAGPYTLDQLGGDALALLDALGIDRAAVCGLSLGGMVGLWLASHAAERVDRLLVANSTAWFPDKDLWTTRIRAVQQGGLAAIADGVLGRWFTAEFAGRTPHAVARLRAMLAGTPAGGYAGCCAALREADLRPLLSRIAAPTLIVGGQADTATPMAMAEAMAEAIPGARLAALPAAHLSNIEAERDFNRLLGEFLAD